jgi:hypothetical protein
MSEPALRPKLTATGTAGFLQSTAAETVESFYRV